MKAFMGFGIVLWLWFTVHGIYSIWRGYSALMAMSR